MTLCILLSLAAIYAIALHLHRRELLDKALWVHGAAWGWNKDRDIYFGIPESDVSALDLIRAILWPCAVMVVTDAGAVSWCVRRGETCCEAVCFRSDAVFKHPTAANVARRMLQHQWTIDADAARASRASWSAKP